jgi:hypothetical protein
MHSPDLTVRPPRGPREMLAGVYFLPRTIDKLRAERAGRLGTYLTTYDRGLSAYVLHKLGITFDELRTVVAESPDDAAVESWLTARIEPGAGEKINARLESITIAAMTPDNRRLFFDRHPALAEGACPDNLLDALEADDATLA